MPMVATVTNWVNAYRTAHTSKPIANANGSVFLGSFTSPEGARVFSNPEYAKINNNNARNHAEMPGCVNSIIDKVCG